VDNSLKINTAQTLRVSYSASNVSFFLKAGPVQVKVTFISPILLAHETLKLHSQPMSYLDVHIYPTDNKTHHIKLYGDIDCKWATGDYDNSIVEWQLGINKGGNGTLMSHVFHNQVEKLFSEVQEKAEWGKVYYSTSLNGNVTYQVDGSGKIRERFLKHGSLDNKSHGKYRTCLDDTPTFGFAHDLGRLNSTKR
jgi:hypothetical protein